MQPFSITRLRGGFAVTFNDREGKRRRYALQAKNKRDATPEAVEIVKEFFHVSQDTITVKEVWDKYVKSLGSRPAAKRMKNMPDIMQYFGGYKPSQIDDDLVDAYIKNRKHRKTKEPASAETLWTELGALRDALSWGRKRKLLAPDDKPYIKRPSKPAPRDRPLSRDEVRMLLQAAKPTPHLYMALLLLLGTAGRVSAVLELEWDRIDFQKETIDLRVETKGPQKGRAKVPMNPGLRDELLKWKEVSITSRVITWADKPIKSIKTAFKAAVKAAGLEDVRIHDIRHTAAVWMLEAGSSIARISQYLGHSTLEQTFKVYARYQPDFLRPEAASLDVSELVNSSSEDVENFSRKTVYLHDTEEYLALTVYKRHHPLLAEYLKENSDDVVQQILKMQKSSSGLSHAS